MEKGKDEPSQRTTATSQPKLNQAQEQARTAKKRQEKIEKVANAVLEQLEYRYGIDTLRVQALSNAIAEERKAKRNGTTNGNQLQSNHGPSNPTRRHEPLELTSAEHLRTREFEWTTVKRKTKMEAAQRPPPATIQAYNVEQRESAQTDASLAAKPAKKKKKSQQKRTALHLKLNSGGRQSKQKSSELLLTRNLRGN